jgi:PilZ domain
MLRLCPGILLAPVRRREQLTNFESAMNAGKKDDAAAQGDRRMDQRLTTRLDAAVEDAEHGTLHFITSGFSRSGAFLKRRDGATPLPAIGSVIQIVFRWPLETHMPPVRVEATVVRQTDDGVGVRFQIAG